MQARTVAGCRSMLQTVTRVDHPSLERPPRRGVLAGVSTRLLGLAILAALVATAGALSIAVGSKPIDLSTVADALLRYDGSLDDHLIVRELRLPRTVLTLVVGVALGLAGAIMQGVTRNPLADPGLLGVNAGAALAVVIGIRAFGLTSPGGYVWFAFGGAGAAGLVVYLLGSLGRGGSTPVKLAIAGAALSALLGSFTAALLLLDTATLDQFRFWAVGSTAGRDLTVVWEVLPFIAVGSVIGLATGRALNGLALGDDVARSLGQRVSWVRLATAAAVVLLTGAAVAAAGPIGFVGLTVPHVARVVTGPDHRWLLPYSMLMGAILLLSADVVGRVIARPGEIEVGIITAFVGAPVFIAFVRRRRIAEL
jgi:iron complex transport system permease protein